MQGVGDNESYISPAACGPSARFVIKKNKLNLIHRCKEEAFKVGGKKVVYVEIEHGKGMDCPAGCIYKGVTSIVSGNKESKITAKPDRSVVGVNLEIGEQFRCWPEQSLAKNTTLLIDRGEYKWKIPYNEKRTDEFGNQCVVKGYVLAGRINDYSQISVSFPVSVRNCKGNDKCVSAVAEAKLDTALCSTVKDQTYRNGCYLGIAVRRFDKSLCDKLVYGSQIDDFQKERCLNNISRFRPSKKIK